jgi:hypothetical protein
MPTKPRLRKPSKAGILVATMVAAASLAAAAAALNPFSATTGIEVQAGDPNAPAIGTGQAIAMGASNDVSVGDGLTQDIQFAPGYESWRAGTIAFQTSLGPGSPPAGQAYMTSSALRWQVAESAACSWLSYYVASESAGNAAAAASAAAQVSAAPNWPPITGYDRPTRLGPAVAAVDAGDPKLVQALIDTGQAGNCTALGPFPPAGMSIADSQAQLAADSQLGQQEIATDRVAHRLGISGS